MKIEIKHIEEVKIAFANMQSKEDLLKLLNMVKLVLFEEKEFKPIELSRLTYYANPNFSKKRYVEFTVKKKAGGLRTIHAPVGSLKIIQQCLNHIFQCLYTPNIAAHGFVIGKSIVTNASLHCNKFYVYNIDLKDFFPSVHGPRVKTTLKLSPFNLAGDKGHPREQLAFLISKLCTHPFEFEENGTKITRDVLPQGAPTSPTLTNIIANNLDRKLTGLAKRFGATYTRYADDITFSSGHSIYQKEGEFLIELNKIITEQGFTINPKKTRLQKNVYKQEVTGLTVNTKPNVDSTYVKRIRTMIKNWEVDFVQAEKMFIYNYSKDKGHIKKGKPSFENVLSGKLEFLKMVKGKENPTYLNLKKRYDILVNKKAESDQDKIDMNRILEVIINKGLGLGIELYNRFKNQS